MKLREHLTYANVAATLALAGVIGGGGAYAAGVIDSGDIVDNSIESRDLRNRDAVANRDVKRDGLKGRAIKERTLDASEFAPLAGGSGSCNPTDTTFISCASSTVKLGSAGRVLVIATGDFFNEGATSSLDCRIAIDGTNESGGSTPGEQTDSTNLGATDGFARTLVTDRLPRGSHTAALRCAEPVGDDGRLATASIAVLGISG
jgi:hypothetical protein